MCERTPLAEVLLLPGNGARKLLDVCVGYPKLKVMMMHIRKFSLIMKPRFSNQEEKRVASEGVAFVAPQQRRQKLIDGNGTRKLLVVAVGDAMWATWNLHTTQKILCPN